MRSLAKLSFTDAQEVAEKSHTDLGYSHRLEPSIHPRSLSDFISLSLRTITWSRELKRAQAVAMETEAGPEEREGQLREPLDWNFPGSHIFEGDLGGGTGRCREGMEDLGDRWLVFKMARQVHLWCILNVCGKKEWGCGECLPGMQEFLGLMPSAE